MSTPEDVHNQTEEKMKKAIAATQKEMGAIRTGRANPLMLERVMVDYYGTPTPINQMANVSVQGGQTLIIQPYDKSALSEIEKAISKSDLNLPPNNDGTAIRLNVPPLTEERRKEMVKQVKKIGEDGKVFIRNIRRDGGSDLDKVKKEANLSEDQFHDHQDKLQKLTDLYNKQMELLVSEKEKELMSI